jgi:3-dehydroquinate synthase
MTAIPVGLGHRSYAVIIEPDAIDQAARHLSPWAPRGRLIVITDETVAALYLPRLRAGLGAIAVEPIILPPGEGTKSWAQLQALTDRLLELELERGEAVVALGGGVIGDLAGFAASIVKRGCPIVQIPTSLLAQVDSSVGGKTAINTAAGKNLIGAFHQPALVLIDPGTLATLPLRELRAGYAEIVKYGLIDDAGFFGWCERNGAALLAGDVEARVTAIAHSVAAKAAIVSDDEREMSGRRALLNLGHTFGHALEAEMGYSGRLLHGEAVAAGMAIAFRFSAAIGLCGADEAARVGAHLAESGLPTSARAAGVAASGATLISHMAHDKKRSGGSVPFLLARGIGQTFLATDIAITAVAAFLDRDDG